MSALARTWIGFGTNGTEPDPDARVLKTMKNNHGPVGGEIRLRWRNHVFVTSDGSAEGSAKDAMAEMVFLVCSASIRIQIDR